MTPDQITTDADRWGYRTGARFVGPDEWLRNIPADVQRVLHLDVLTQGLAEASDEEGQLLNFRPNQFYPGPLSEVMRNEDDKPSWQLQYDRFAAMVLMDAKFRLVEAGLLATRGNGNSVDYRLCLPASGSEA
jgi:hypothetical protein